MGEFLNHGMAQAGIAPLEGPSRFDKNNELLPFFGDPFPKMPADIDVRCSASWTCLITRGIRRQRGAEISFLSSTIKPVVHHWCPRISQNCLKYKRPALYCRWWFTRGNICTSVIAERIPWKTIIAICTALSSPIYWRQFSSDEVILRAHITPIQYCIVLFQAFEVIEGGQCTESNVCLATGIAAKTLPHRSPLVTHGSRPMRAQCWASLRSDWPSLTPLPRAVITSLARHMLRLTVGVSPRHLAFTILLNSQISA